jgi:carboxypeptidase family protein
MKEGCVLSSNGLKTFIINVLAILLSLPSLLAAGDGQLLGTVVGTDGEALNGVSVQITSSNGYIAADLVSDQNGRFTATGLSAGDYVVIARAKGRMSPLSTATVDAGHETQVTVKFGQLAVSTVDRDAEIDRKIALLQNQLSLVQGQLQELVAERRLAKTHAPVRPENTAATVALAEKPVPATESEPVLVASVSLGAGVSALPEPAQVSGGLYKAATPQASPEEQRPGPPMTESDRPGAGFSNKGLYGGLAPGAPGKRYSRGLLGDMVRIGGYGSFRYEANNIPDGPQIGNLPPLKFGHNGFDFRRLVLTVDAAPTKRLRFYSEIEFERLNEIEIERNAIPENRGRETRDRQGTRFIQEVEGTSHGEIALEQAWGQFNFNDEIAVRGGVILPPVGRYNILHDDDYWDLPRRPLSSRGATVTPTKIAWREVGAGVLINKPLGDGYFDAQAYVVNGPRLDFVMEEVVSLREGRNLLELEPEIAFSSGAFDGSQSTAGFTWRTAMSPKLGHEIALSGYHGKYTPDYLTVQPWVHTIAVDGKTTWGNFEVEGEFIYTDFHKFDVVINDIAHQFVDSAAKTFSSETSILETEVEAEFAGPLTDSRAGFWIDFKYRLRPKWLQQVSELDDPHFIPILRWERVWYRDLVRGFEFANSEITSLNTEDTAQERLSIGLALRLMPSVVVSTAWEHNRLLNGGNFIWPQPVGTDPIPGKSFDSFVVGMAFGF